MKFKAEKTENKRSGLFLYLFEENNFKKPFLFGPTSSNGLSCDINIVKDFGLAKTAIKSAKLIGYVKPKHTGSYHVNLSQNFTDCQINLDGQCVVRNTDTKIQKLAVDEWVPIEISLQFDSSITIKQFTDLKLLMIADDGSKTELSHTDLLNPDFRNDRRKWLTNDDDEDIDTDDDAIPDVFEKNGYTIVARVAVKWDKKYEGKYTKFLSNPYLAHTVGDPYTDYEKAAKDMDRTSDPITFNPLVAACPSVKVVLEKTILSPNKDYSRSVGSSSSMNYSATKAQSVDFNSGLSSKGLSVGLSKNWTKSETTGQEWGKSEDNTEHFNSANTAYLNANVRYRNTGTGSIYRLAPTTNFVLDDDTIATLKAKENTIAEGLTSGENYPDGGHGIALNTMDDFSSHPISLNKKQFEYFMSNKGPLLLETIQSAGEFIIMDSHGKPVYGGEWTPYKKAIEKTTANIIIDSGTDVKERYIAAKDFEDFEDLTPVLTVKEAIKLAFKNDIVEKNDGFLYYNDKLFEEAQTLKLVDKYTQKEMEKQINATSGPFKDVKSLYDVKLFPRMALNIKIGVVFEEACLTLNNSFYHTTAQGRLISGSIGPWGWEGTDCFRNTPVMGKYILSDKNRNSLKPGNYYLSIFVEASTINQGILFDLYPHNNINQKLAYFRLDSNMLTRPNWLRVYIPFHLKQGEVLGTIDLQNLDPKNKSDFSFNYFSIFKA